MAHRDALGLWRKRSATTTRKCCGSRGARARSRRPKESMKQNSSWATRSLLGCRAAVDGKLLALGWNSRPVVSAGNEAAADPCSRSSITAQR